MRIFLLLYVSIATFLCCSLEHVFTICKILPLYRNILHLGSWYMLSTHLQ
nr:MAG TPA: hypothetical protein [Caudoviricetes sp.]